MVGIDNVTNITLEDITQIANITSPAEFFINVNHIIYDGVFWFIMLWVLWVILFMAAQQLKKDAMVNLMYSGAVVSVLSLFVRGIIITRVGVFLGFLTYLLLWVFSIITIVLAMIVWSLKD